MTTPEELEAALRDFKKNAMKAGIAKDANTNRFVKSLNSGTTAFLKIGDILEENISD